MAIESGETNEEVHSLVHQFFSPVLRNLSKDSWLLSDDEHFQELLAKIDPVEFTRLISFFFFKDEKPDFFPGN